MLLPETHSTDTVALSDGVCSDVRIHRRLKERVIGCVATLLGSRSSVATNASHGRYLGTWRHHRVLSIVF